MSKCDGLRNDKNNYTSIAIYKLKIDCYLMDVKILEIVLTYPTYMYLIGRLLLRAKLYEILYFSPIFINYFHTTFE